MDKGVIITNEYNPLFRETIPVARFRSCEAHLMERPQEGEINIQYIKSNKEGRGDAQMIVKRLLEVCKRRGLKLTSSTPLCEAWEHICKKYAIKVYA